MPMSAEVKKLDPNRWDTVADLARWLLTHQDEYSVAMVVLQEKKEDGAVLCRWAPPLTTINGLGLLEMAKDMWLEDTR